MFIKKSCALGIVLLSLSPLGHAFFDALLSDGARSEALQDAMDKVSKTCNTANQFAKEYVAMAPENRIYGEVTRACYELPPEVKKVATLGNISIPKTTKCRPANTYGISSS